MEKELIQIAEQYDELEQPFSSASVWAKIVKLNPSTNNLMEYAIQLGLSGNYSTALKIINQVSIENIPVNIRFMYFVQKGLIYDNQGKIKKAVKCYRKSIKVGSTETTPYIFLSALLSKQSKLEEVETVLLEALDKNGDIEEVYYNLSINSARQGKFYQAIQQMEACLTIDEHYPDAQAFLEDFKNMSNQLAQQNSDTL